MSVTTKSQASEQLKKLLGAHAAAVAAYESADGAKKASAGTRIGNLEQELLAAGAAMSVRSDDGEISIIRMDPATFEITHPEQADFTHWTKPVTFSTKNLLSEQELVQAIAQRRAMYEAREALPSDTVHKALYSKVSPWGLRSLLDQATRRNVEVPAGFEPPAE